MAAKEEKRGRTIRGDLCRVLLDRESAAVVVLDAKGVVVSCGSSGRALRGDDPVGLPFETAFAFTKTDGSRLSVSPLLAGLAPRLIEVTFERKDGRRFTLLLDSNPLRRADGSPSGCVITLRDVTGIAAMEAALQESETRFRRLAENLPGMVYRLSLRGNNTMVFFNSMNEKMTGFTAEELRHGDVCSIDPLILAGDRPRVVAEVKRAVAEGRPFEVNYRLRRKDGEVRHFIERGRPLRDEGGEPLFIDGVIFDATEQRRAEIRREDLLDETLRSRDELGRQVRDRMAEIEDANRRLRAEIEDKRLLTAAIEQSGVAMAVTDPSGIIRFANEAFEKAGGWPPGGLTGQRYAEVSLAAVRDDEVQAAVLGAFAAGRAWKGRVSRRGAGGLCFEIAVGVTPIFDASGRLTHFSVTEHDVTREVRLEESLRQKAKMEALGTMAGGIAHDLNNVLGPVLINTEMALLEVPEKGPARDHLMTVLRAGRRGREIIGQILGFSRRRDQAMRRIEIGPIVRECLQFIEATLPPNIEVRADLTAGGTRVRADPTQVHQILLNLISNAISAMEGSGGVLEVGLKNRDVAPEAAALNPDLRPGPYLELKVSDSGSGMTREVMARMFDPFFTTKEPGRGAGLGMAIVRGIVADQGAAIDVTSEPGRGTSVRILIRCESGEPEGRPV